MNRKMFSAALILLVVLTVLTLSLTACKDKKTVVINFESNGGTSVASILVKKGEAVIPPVPPEKTGYTFAGWYFDPAKDVNTFDFSTVTESITLYAKWTINRYTYTFYAGDGTTKLKTETLDYGSAIVPPANPTKTATAQYTYAFTGWDKEIPLALTQNIEFNPVFSQTVNRYTYTFYAEDGTTELKTKTLDYGSAIVPPANPTKTATAQYTYTFAGWGKDIPSSLTQNITFTAAFTQTVNKYTYTFYAEDGTTKLKTETLDYGSAIVPPANPTKTATAQYTYAFTGWDKEIPAALTQNIEFNPVFSQTVNKYTYTFYAEDGTTKLKTETLDYGSAIVPPANPTKTATAQYTYAFTGWDKEIPLALTQNIEFNPVFSQTVNRYTYTFYAEDGITELKTETLDYGSTIVPPATGKAATELYYYTFNGWGKEIPSSLTEDITFTASYLETKVVYKISFDEAGGGPVADIEKAWGEEVSAPTPIRAGYTFISWLDGEGQTYVLTVMPVGGIALYADWTANANTLNFDGNGAEGTMSSMSIATDETVTLSKNLFEYPGYTFTGWATSEGGLAAYSDEASYTMGPLSSYTLYAVWIANTNELLLDPNGALGAAISIYIDSFEMVTLPQNTFTRSGYTFLGWAETPEGAAVYQDKGDYTMGADEIYVLYAVWSAIPGTEGLVYSLVNFGSEYEVSGIGMASGDIVVPTYYDGIPVTRIGYHAFDGCETLTSVLIADGVKVIDSWAFARCFNLVSVTLPDTLEEIGLEAFFDSGLTNIVLPGNLITIGNNAFSGSGLTSVRIPKNVANSDQAFLDCRSLTEIIVDEENINYISVDGVLFNDLGTILFTYPAGKTNASYSVPWGVNTISDSAFINNIHLQNVSLEGGVTSIGAYAFKNCASLMNINLLASIESIGMEGFSFCSNLVNITIPAGITELSANLFAGCVSLETVIILGSNLTSIWSGAFSLCESLKDFIIPSGVINMGAEVFGGCAALTLYCELSEAPAGWDAQWNPDPAPVVWMSDGIKREYTFVTDGGSAIEPVDAYNVSSAPVTTKTGYEIVGWYTDDQFSGSPVSFPYFSKTNLTLYVRWMLSGTEGLQFTLIEGDKYEVSDAGSAWNQSKIVIPEYYLGLPVVGIGDEAFIGCEDLTEIVLPDSLTYIGDYAFEDCCYLTGITLPAGITRIGKSAFHYCEGLTELILPDGLTDIGEEAFLSCISITLIRLPKSLINLGVYAFSSCISLTAFEVDEENANFKSIDGILFDITGKTLLMYPSGRSGAYTVSEGITKIGAGAFYGCHNLTSITIAASVETIGERAFTSCHGLSSAVFAGDSLLTSIESWAFCYSGIETIELPQGLLSIGEQAFYSCENLVSINIPDGITHIDKRTFAFCIKLESVTLGADSLLQELGERVFFECEKLNGIQIPAGVTYIGNEAFYNCCSLESVIFASESNLKTIGTSVFSDCISLVSIVIPAGVETVGDNVFVRCSSLKSVEFAPDGALESIGTYAFFACKLLETVTFSASLTSIGSYAFSQCEALKSLTIYAETPPALAFFALVTGHMNFRINVPADSVEQYKSAWPSFAGIINSISSGESLEYELINEDAEYEVRGLGTVTGSSVTVPATYNGKPVTSIGTDAFYECESITEIILSEGLKEIGEYAFAYCTSITSIVIPASVTFINFGAFSSCDALLSVSFADGSLLESVGTSAFGGTGIETIAFPEGLITFGDGVFESCPYLTSIYIPASVTSIGMFAMFDCPSLQTVTFGEDSLLETIGMGAFNNCELLQNIQIPAGVTNIGAGAFVNCKNLTSVTIPAGVESIEAQTFNFCTSLGEVIFASGSRLMWICDEAFSHCEILESIIIPASVVAIGIATFDSTYLLKEVLFAAGSVLLSIYSYAFDNSGLEKITLPASMDYIGENAFLSCTAFYEITVLAEYPPTLSWGAFEDANPSLQIFVPEASLNDYKAAAGWSEYADRIYAI